MKLGNFKLDGDSFSGVLLDQEHVMNLSEAARIFRRNSLTEFSSTDNIIRGNRMEDVRQILNMVKDNSKRTENSKGGILINSLSDVEFLTPLLHPGKLILAAVNYSAHGSEGNLNIPERPYFFTKFPECMIPHNGTVIAPRISDQTDYEAELAVVMGREIY